MRLLSHLSKGLKPSDGNPLEAVALDQLGPQAGPEENTEPKHTLGFPPAPVDKPNAGGSKVPLLLSLIALLLSLGGNAYLYLTFTDQLKAVEEAASTAVAQGEKLEQTLDNKIAHATAGFPKQIREGVESLRKDMAQSVKQEVAGLQLKLEELEKSEKARRSVASVPKSASKASKKKKR